MATTNGQETTVTFSGGKEIEKILKNLPLNVQREIGLKATKEGGQVILEEAQRLAPVRTGRMFNAIDMVVSPNSKNEISVEIGVIRGAKRGDKKGAWYAHFVEFGRRDMQTFKAGRGKYKGQMVTRRGTGERKHAQPFLRPALDTKWTEAVAITGKALWKFIDKFVASGRRK